MKELENGFYWADVNGAREVIEALYGILYQGQVEIARVKVSNINPNPIIED